MEYHKVLLPAQTAPMLEESELIIRIDKDGLLDLSSIENLDSLSATDLRAIAKVLDNFTRNQFIHE